MARNKKNKYNEGPFYVFLQIVSYLKGGGGELKNNFLLKMKV